MSDQATHETRADQVEDRDPALIFGTTIFGTTTTVANPRRIRLSRLHEHGADSPR